MKARVFVGSTGEGKRYADAIVAELGTDVTCHPWHQGVFEVGGNTQASLLRAIAASDFAILVLTAEDTTNSRGKEYFSPRDNLVFEAGVSFGAVNPTRTFLVPVSKPGLKLPTDLAGFNLTQPFDPSESPKDAMVGPIAQIRQRIQELGRRPEQQHSGGAEKLASAAVNLLRSADHTIVLFGRDLSWAPKYADVIRERVDAGVSVEVFSDEESRRKARGNAQVLSEAGARIYYCERDPVIKLTLIDHKADSVCRFMISFKERNPSYMDGGGPGELSFDFVASPAKGAFGNLGEFTVPARSCPRPQENWCNPRRNQPPLRANSRYF